MSFTLTPRDFVTKWRGDTRKERSASQEHFIDLCRLVGHETPGENRDSTLVFEAGAAKSEGGQGWADVWKKGYFAWEYKGPGGDIVKAYRQLQQYRDSLLNPPLLVVSDIQTIIIHTNFVNTVKQTHTITIEALETPEGLQLLRNIFYNPRALEPGLTIQQVTEDAAAEFARLAELRRCYGDKPQEIAHFLIRLLFCIFAEDVGLLPSGLFTKIVAATRHKAPLFADRIKNLFGAMANGGAFGMDEIKHFNGGLFNDDTVLLLDSESLGILKRAGDLDWSNIEPSIFGTLFERGLDPSKRSQLGAHYTSRDDILLIVEPVLMVPLRRKWEEIQVKAHSLASQRDVAVGPMRYRIKADLQRLLLDFASEIALTRVLDPACGSGNFLYVALKQLLGLQKQVINLASSLGLQPIQITVSPDQLYGIEINEYAHELAQVTVWIGYIQWLRDNGFGEPSEPILPPLNTIKHMDAILAFDETGKPVEPEWPEVDVIVGNPPFLGDKKMRAELGDKYVEAVRRLYEGRVPGGADLVTYWFERVRALIEDGKVRRAGLLATQGIRGIANRRVLERIKATGDIFMAWSDRPWVLNGAAVRVAMVGFDDGTEIERVADGQTVTVIHSNLSGIVAVAEAAALMENNGIAFMGMMKAGKFDLDGDTARRILASTSNPSGRSNADVVRRRLGGQDVTGRWRDTWIIDFGVDMSEAEAAQYDQPFAYVLQHVKPERDSNRRDTMRLRWWIHGEPRRGLRSAITVRGLRRVIVTPEVSKHRLFVWMDTSVVPDHKLHVFARDDDYFFGVLQARPHTVWTLKTAIPQGDGQDGGRPTYKALCFETYPFPWPPGSEPSADPRVEAIAAAARRLVELRDNWLNPPGADETELKKRTLTNLYNQRPTWLDIAHKKLDAAVFDAYGWSHDLTSEQILERLLTLNLERAGKKVS